MRKIIFLLLFVPFIVSAQKDSTDFIISRMMKEQGIVGLSLVVIKEGNPVINKGYGLANVEHKIPLSSETVIRLGSVSKQFFTTAILKLSEQGKLSIEDSVHKFFPDAPETWRPIQIKHLMSHSSGLKREGPAYANHIIQPDIDIIRSAYSLPLDFKTGEKYQYCNLAYYMLADIIAQVSKMPWHEYIRKELFIPAGMNNTNVVDFFAITPNRANGYAHRKDTLINADPNYAVRPSGGFHSTNADMIRWDKVLREKKIILKKENWELLWKPFIKTNDNPNSKSYYCFGWITDVYKGGKIIMHSGANSGFRSAYARYVDADLSIIIMTNTEEANPGAIVNTLAEYYFKK